MRSFVPFYVARRGPWNYKKGKPLRPTAPRICFRNRGGMTGKRSLARSSHNSPSSAHAFPTPPCTLLGPLRARLGPASRKTMEDQPRRPSGPRGFLTSRGDGRTTIAEFLIAYIALDSYTALIGHTSTYISWPVFEPVEVLGSTRRTSRGGRAGPAGPSVLGTMGQANHLRPSHRLGRLRYPYGALWPHPHVRYLARF